MSQALQLIDSHCHVSDRWFEPVEALLFQMERHGVERAVLVQLLGQHDNAYQQDCVQRHAGRLATVVSVDVTRDDAPAALRRWAELGAAGVRLRPGDRSPGADPLAVWRAAQDLRLPVSCVGNAAAFASPEFAQLVQALPRLPIVLEHFGATSSPDADEAAAALRLSAFELARFPNVFMKLPGLGELVPRPQLRVFAPDGPTVPGLPMLAQALRAFGPERLMWGSDHPVVASREGYGQALAWAREAVQALDAGAVPQVFGGTAANVFFSRM